MGAKLGDTRSGLLSRVSGKPEQSPCVFMGLAISGPWMVSAKKDFDASLCSSEKKNEEIDQMVTFVPLILCILQHGSK